MLIVVGAWAQVASKVQVSVGANRDFGDLKKFAKRIRDTLLSSAKYGGWLAKFKEEDAENLFKSGSVRSTAQYELTLMQSEDVDEMSRLLNDLNQMKTDQEDNETELSQKAQEKLALGERMR